MTETRLVGPEDWQVWRALRLMALAEAPYAFATTLAQWQGSGDEEQRWRARLALPGSHNVLAYDGGAPVGMISGASGEDGEVELVSLWVSPRMRGRGVGDELVREVEGWARASGARQLRLTVTVGNEVAFALYRRNGYVDTGRREPMPDGVREEIVMVKPLEGQARRV